VKLKQFGIRLTNQDYEFFKRLGKGHFASGVREAARLLKEKENV
jgi:hypothetical protein